MADAAETFVDVFTLGPLRRRLTSSAPAAGTRAQSDAAVSSPADAIAHAMNNMKRGLTRAVEHLEGLEATLAVTAGPRVYAQLSGSQDWTDASPYDSRTPGGALAIRLAGGWDSRQSLFRRTAAARAAAMGLAGVNASGGRVETDAEHEARNDTATGAWIKGLAEGAADQAKKIGQAAADTAAGATSYMPWAVGLLVVALAAGLFLRARG